MIGTCAASSEADVLEACFQPWLRAHPSWLEPQVAPPWWQSGFARSACTRRLGYRWWCQHFGIEPCPPWPLAWPQGLSLRAQALHDAALRIGMVVHASDVHFMRQWVTDRAQLLAIESAHAWREALRWALARPLRANAPALAQPLSRESLVTIGLASLRSAVELLQPGLWSRVQFRCDWRLLQDETTPVPMLSSADDSLCKQVVRIWMRCSSRAAATVPPPSI